MLSNDLTQIPHPPFASFLFICPSANFSVGTFCRWKWTTFHCHSPRLICQPMISTLAFDWLECLRKSACTIFWPDAWGRMTRIECLSSSVIRPFSPTTKKCAKERREKTKYWNHWNASFLFTYSFIRLTIFLSTDLSICLSISLIVFLSIYVSPVWFSFFWYYRCIHSDWWMFYFAIVLAI